jgi:RNA polymerase sigma-70 factor (ECF subfamily)
MDSTFLWHMASISFPCFSLVRNLLVLCLFSWILRWHLRAALPASRYFRLPPELRKAGRNLAVRIGKFLKPKPLFANQSFSGLIWLWIRVAEQAIYVAYSIGLLSGFQQMTRRQDHTSMGGAGRQFPATEWTRMLTHPQREVILADLCRDYWKPVYCYLRSMGFGNEQAKDLVQGFFTDKVLGRQFVQKADRTKGRFRSFLLRSVRNYAISVQRTVKPHDTVDDSQRANPATADPETEFNRVWADKVLQDVLQELEEECEQRGKTTHWQIFHDWLLVPSIGGQKRAVSDLCTKYGLRDASRAYHMIENVKRRFRTLLRSHLAPLTGSDAEVEPEIRDFIEIFSRGAART